MTAGAGHRVAYADVGTTIAAREDAGVPFSQGRGVPSQIATLALLVRPEDGPKADGCGGRPCLTKPDEGTGTRYAPETWRAGGGPLDFGRGSPCAHVHGLRSQALPRLAVRLDPTRARSETSGQVADEVIAHLGCPLKKSTGVLCPDVPPGPQATKYLVPAGNEPASARLRTWTREPYSHTLNRRSGEGWRSHALIPVGRGGPQSSPTSSIGPKLAELGHVPTSWVQRQQLRHSVCVQLSYILSSPPLGWRTCSTISPI